MDIKWITENRLNCPIRKVIRGEKIKLFDIIFGKEYKIDIMHSLYSEYLQNLLKPKVNIMVFQEIKKFRHIFLYPES